MKEKTNRIPLWQIWVVVAVCILTVIGCTSYLFVAEQKTDTLVVELGEELPVDIHEYLIGLDWALNFSELDVSDVEEDEVGVYTATVKHGWQEFSYTIKVEDTIPPELIIKDKDFYLLKDEPFDVDEFVEKVEDASDNVKISMKGDIGSSSSKDKVLYTQCGRHTFTIEAEDGSGNRTTEKIKVVVDTSPVFAGVKEFYVAVGSTIDGAGDVIASDDVDGDVTDCIEVDMADVDTSVCGDYEINYYVEDSYGLVTEETTAVHVMEAVDVQECLNTRQINTEEYQIVGAINPYDMGYFPDDNVERTMDELNPALVRIYYDRGGGSYSFGSGYIIEINDENIVICSNEHVVEDAAKWRMDIYFYNGTLAQGTVVSKHDSNDIGFATVPISSLSPEFVETLKTVHINKGYWDGLAQNEPLSLGMSCVNKNGGIWVEYTGNLIQKLTNPPPEFRSASNWVVTEVSVKLIHGVSGSPIVDGYGNLIGMARAVSSGSGYKTYYWAVPLNQILDFYEETFGKRLEYY